MASDVSRSIKKSEAWARSEFYPNSTKEVLNNVIDRVSYSVHTGSYWETQML